MDNLTDVYNQFASIDQELEKQASEMVKQAEEEEFAGRIMARGFADELNKLAAPGQIDRPKRVATTPAGGAASAGAPANIDFSESQGTKITGPKKLKGGDSVSFKPERVKANKALAFAPGGTPGNRFGSAAMQAQQRQPKSKTRMAEAGGTKTTPPARTAPLVAANTRR